MSVLRIVRLIRLLLEGPCRARDLAGELEVSTRTIARDIQLLQKAGVPVYTQPGRDGGIFLHLSENGPEDTAAPPALERLLEELASSPDLEAAEAANRLGQFFAGMPAYLERTGRIFVQVSEVMEKRLSAHMSYVNQLGRVRRMRLRPEALVWQNDMWTLVASTGVLGGNAYIPLHRILEVKGARSQQPVTLPRSAPCRRVHFYVPMDCALGVRRIFGRDRLRPQPNGEIEILVGTARELMAMGLLLTMDVPVRIDGDPDLCQRAVREIRHVFDVADAALETPDGPFSL